MTKQRIFDLLRQNIVDTLPELAESEIEIEAKLRDLGANSIDRADIIIQTMSDLNVKLSLVAFAKCKNISEIVSVFESGVAQQ